MTGVGWVESQNNIVSASTKAGKSSFMVGAALYALSEGRKVVYVTLADLDAQQLKRRILKADCGIGGVSPDMERYVQFESALERHNDPFGDFANLKVYDARDDGNSWDVDVFIPQLERWHREHFPFDMAIIDYAQKLQYGKYKVADRVAMLEGAVDQIEKRIARRLRIPVVIGSQLTKMTDGTWMTKGARALEEGAGFVVQVKVAEDRKSATIDVPYNRFGPSGLGFDADWDSNRVQFTNVRLRA